MGCRNRTIAVLVVFGTLVAEAGARALEPAATWDQARAAHLLRRAGFGGTPAEIEKLVGLGVDGAVDLLVDYDKTAQTHRDFEPVVGPDRRAFRVHLKELAPEQAEEAQQQLRQLDRIQIEEMRAWWLERMVCTPRPLQEKMTLFWHGHFTSGHREVRNSSLMHAQNELFRRSAVGDFRELLNAVSQDPAMLRYLDNASNRKQAPNENYARELLELFTLGVGNYTERDIKEAARALTGWTVREDAFVNVRRWHDDGDKTFLGRTGPFDGVEIIDIILDSPAAAEHLARRLLVFFVTDEPDEALVIQLADVVRACDFNLRETLRALFKSEAFYAAEVMHAKIKSPVELTVGMLRVLEIEPRDVLALARAVGGMGQELYQPPNVKGWPGGRAWVNTATVFARYNFASGLLTGTESRASAKLMMGGASPNRMARRIDRHRAALQNREDLYPGLKVPDAQVDSSPQPPFDPTPIVEAYRLYNADKVLNHFSQRILQMRVDPAQRKALRKLLTAGTRKFDPRTADGKHRIVSLVNTLLTMPEYQAN